MTQSQPCELICYGFKAGEDCCSMEKQPTRLFDLQQNEVNLQSGMASFVSEDRYTDTKSRVAEKFAMQAGLDVNCGPFFSASAKMAMSTQSNSFSHSARTETTTKFIMYGVHSNILGRDPGSKLTPHARQVLLHGSMQDVANLGHMYCEQGKLGGFLNVAHIMDMKQSDTEISIRAELTAKFGSALMGGSINVSTQYDKRKSDESLQIETKTLVKGGDPRLWLSFNGTNKDHVQQRWADSVNDSNLFFFSSNMKPIWELVRRAGADHQRVDQVKDYILDHCEMDPFPDSYRTEVIFKKVKVEEMFERCSTAGSPAKQYLACMEKIEDGWLMLGHTPKIEGWDAVLVREGFMVKRQTGWKRVWWDQGSRLSKDYDIYIPTYDQDENFKALGVVCWFNSRGHAKPPANYPVALVHKDVCTVTGLGGSVWRDAGMRCRHDISLQPHWDGTMWPDPNYGTRLCPIDMPVRLRDECKIPARYADHYRPKDHLVFITSHRKRQLMDDANVQPYQDGGVRLSTTKWGWEEWRLTDAGDGKVFITSHRSKHLIDMEGAIRMSNDRNGWEQWTITRADGGRWFITSHRQQQLQDANGVIRLTTDRTASEQWVISPQPICS